jgi:hypothetical protein
MILAQIISQEEFATPPHLTEWLQCATYVAIMIAAGMHVWRQLHPREEKPALPQPLVVANEVIFAEKEAMEKRIKEVEDKTEKRFQHVESKIEAARIENKAEKEKLGNEAVVGRRNLHNDIKAQGEMLTEKLSDFAVDITGAVGELKGELKRVNGKNH